MVTPVTIPEAAHPLPSDGSAFRHRYPSLDGLRGLAILAVFFCHYSTNVDTIPHAAGRLISKVLYLGWSGVDLFFVLSGFLITGILYDTQRDSAYYSKFYARRALRIVPIYYFAAAVMAIAGGILGVHWKLAHLSFLLYFGYPAAIIWPTLVQVSPWLRFDHLWSLSVEEQFYMGWPWIIRRLRSAKNIMLASLAMVLVALLLRIALAYLVGTAWSYAFLFCRMDALAVGSVIAMVARGSYWRILQSCAMPVFLLGAVAFVGLCALRHTVHHDDPSIATWGFTLLAIVYGALLILALEKWSVLFSWQALRMFGRYSYGLYLYHFPLTIVLKPIKASLVAITGSITAGTLTYVAFCLGVNLTVAALSFHFIESPIMKLKRRFDYNVDARAEDSADCEKMDVESGRWAEVRT